MLFGLLCISIVQSAATIALIGVVVKLRDVVLTLQEQVYDMTTSQDAVAQDIAAIKAGIASWNAAAAANLDAKLAEAKAAWEADDEAAWSAAHAELSDLAKTFASSSPVTPPATPSEPSPAPVPSPADPAPAPADPAPAPVDPTPPADASGV